MSDWVDMRPGRVPPWMQPRDELLVFDADDDAWEDQQFARALTAERFGDPAGAAAELTTQPSPIWARRPSQIIRRRHDGDLTTRRRQHVLLLALDGAGDSADPSAHHPARGAA